MADELVLAEIRAGYRVLTLNRPDRLNSFSAAMHQALMAALIEAEADTHCRALVLTGAGRGFCAGQDLSDRHGDAGPRLRTSSRHHRATLQSAACASCAACRCRWSARSTASRPAPAPTIAFACDIVLAGRSRKIHPGLRQDRPGARLPAAPGCCRACSAARAPGRWRLLAEPLGAEQAAAWGLIWKARRRRRADDRGASRSRAHLAHPADRGPGADQARARGRGHQHARRAARPGARPAGRGRPHAGLSPRASPPSSKSARRGSREGLMDARTPPRRPAGAGGSLRGGDVERPTAPARRSACDRQDRAGRGDAVAWRCAHDMTQRPRHLPWRLHLHAGRLRLRLCLQHLRPAHRGAAMRDHLHPPGAGRRRR